MKKLKAWNHIMLERADIKMNRPRGWSLFVLSVVVLMISLQPSSLFACQYSIEPDKSILSFKIETRNGGWLKGQFRKVSGDFLFNDCDPKIDTYFLKIDTASLLADSEETKKLLGGIWFFNINKYPLITFRSEWYNLKIAKGIVDGVLVMKGSKKKVSLRIRKISEKYIPDVGERVVLAGESVINLKAFGIENSYLSDKGIMVLNLRMVGLR